MGAPPPEVADLLVRAGLATPDGAARCGATWVPSLTNRTYRVRCPAGEAAVRLSGEGVAAVVDREIEAHNAGQAAEVGLGPDVLYADPECGALVTGWVPGASSLAPAPPLREEQLQACGRALRRLHRSGASFRGEVRLDVEIARYVELAGRAGATWPEEAEAALAAVAVPIAVLSRHPQPTAPCHNDPSPANWLFLEDRAMLVDWEYSSRNEPAWDLACLAAEAALSPDEEAALLAAYFGGRPSPTALARHALWRPALELLSALWLLARDAARPVDGLDGARTAAERMARSLAAMRRLDPEGLRSALAES